MIPCELQDRIRKLEALLQEKKESPTIQEGWKNQNPPVIEPLKG
jgi:hypothetical protein